MAGTDISKPDISSDWPAIILVEPQLGENIGAAARAMRNFGLGQLRLVAPRDGWPNERAIATASGADLVLERAAVFPTTAEAIADLTFVAAATARRRELEKPLLGAEGCVAQTRSALAAGGRVGVMFGGERAGLSTEDVARADVIMSYPVNPAFASLNLAHAVCVFAYAWRNADGAAPPPNVQIEPSPAASHADLDRLFRHLEDELIAAGFLFPPEKAPTMMRNLRTTLQRAALTDNDVRTLRGVIKALTGRRGP